MEVEEKLVVEKPKKKCTVQLTGLWRRVCEACVFTYGRWEEFLSASLATVSPSTHPPTLPGTLSSMLNYFIIITMILTLRNVCTPPLTQCSQRDNLVKSNENLNSIMSKPISEHIVQYTRHRKGERLCGMEHRNQILYIIIGYPCGYLR